MGDVCGLCSNEDPGEWLRRSDLDIIPTKGFNFFEEQMGTILVTIP